MKENEDNMEPCIPNLIENFNALKLAISEFVKAAPTFPNDEKLAVDLGTALGKLQVAIIANFFDPVDPLGI